MNRRPHILQIISGGLLLLFCLFIVHLEYLYHRLLLLASLTFCLSNFDRLDPVGRIVAK